MYKFTAAGCNSYELRQIYLAVLIFFTLITVPNSAYSQKNPSPVINSVVPDSGLENKETLLTVEGKNILRGARVMVGDEQSSTVAFFPSKKIVVYSPPRPRSSVDITLINPDGQSFTLKNGFRYLTKEEQDLEEQKRSSTKIVTADLNESDEFEKIKNLLAPYEPYIIKSLVYAGIFIVLFILLSMNKKKRLIKKIIKEKKNISVNNKQ